MDELENALKVLVTAITDKEAQLASEAEAEQAAVTEVETRFGQLSQRLWEREQAIAGLDATVCELRGEVDRLLSSNASLQRQIGNLQEKEEATAKQHLNAMGSRQLEVARLREELEAKGEECGEAVAKLQAEVDSLQCAKASLELSVRGREGESANELASLRERVWTLERERLSRRVALKR